MSVGKGKGTGERRRVRGPDGRYESRCTHDVIEKICLGLKAGVAIETACAWAEIDDWTMSRWYKRVAAGTGSPMERRFVAATSQALAEFKVSKAALLTSPECPKHVLMDYMGRRFPDEFGPKQRVDQRVSGSVEHRQTFLMDVEVYTDEELTELHRLLKKGEDAAQQKAEPAGELLVLPAR